MTDFVTSNVNDEAFSTVRDFIISSFSDLYPNLDPTPGTALYDLLITPEAKLEALNQTRQAAFFAGYGLDFVADQTDEVVDATLNRYFLSRNQGSTATGTITIVTSNTTTTIVPVGTEFVAGETTFVASVGIRAFANQASATSANDVVFLPYAENQFYFQVPATAVETGSSSNIAQKTPFTAPSGFTNFVELFAAADFQGGAAAETNAEAIARIPERFSAETVGTNLSIISTINSQFGTSDVSIVEKGDTALLRDSRNPLGMSVGGFCDVYVRPQVRPSFEEKEVTAYVVDPTTNLLEIRLEGADAGAYGVQDISPIGKSGALAIQETITSIIPDDGAYRPTIPTAQDAAYSKYGLLTVRFIDDVQSTINLSVGDTRTYRATIFKMPLSGDIATYLEDAEIRNPGVDLLVRAVTPVVVGAAFTIRQFAGDPVVDLAAVKTAIVEAVGEYGIGRAYLDSGLVIGAVQPFLGPRSYVDTTSTILTGTVYDHKGVTGAINSDNSITVAERPEDGVSATTIGFLISESLIDISVEQFA